MESKKQIKVEQGKNDPELQRGQAAVVGRAVRVDLINKVRFEQIYEADEEMN